MERRHFAALLVSIALTGCAGDGGALEPSPARPVDAVQVEGFEALSSFGVAPHRGVVRAMNRFGAGVHSEPTSDFTVDASPYEVAFDGFGYGAVTVEDAGRVRVSDGSQTAFLDTVVTGWPGVGMHRAWPSPLDARPELAAAVSTGGVAVDGAEIWWIGSAAPAHRVLEADGDILGLAVEHVDVDGVLDVVAWTAQTVFLLRGRAAGGFGWGGAFAADGLSVAGAAVGDVSGDNLPDLVIAWVASDGSGVLDLWEGDGLLGFAAAEPRSLSGRPLSVDIGDNTDEDLGQITVLLDDGAWARFIRGAERQYIPIGPRIPSSVILPRDARLHPSGDLDDDGADEILVASAREDGQPRSVWVFDVEIDAAGCAAGVPDAQCSTEYLPLDDEPGAHLVMADGNGDDVHDLWLLHDDATMYALSHDPAEDAEQQYQRLVVATLPDHGPFGLEDVDFDGSTDLFVAGAARWWQWLGLEHRDLERFWTPRAFETTSVRQPMYGPFDLLEADGDPATLEVVGFTVAGIETHLKVIQKAPEGGSVGIADLQVAGGAVPTDMERCGDDLWVAVQDEVLRIDLANPTSPAIAARGGTAARRVACGTGPSGAVAVMLDGTDVVLLDGSAGEISRSPADGANDVAFGDLGDGPELGTCATEGCTVVFWPYGADGTAVFARGDAAGIEIVDGTDATTPIGGAGVLTVADVDADGHLDLLGLSGALVSLHRSTGASIAPVELMHGAGPMTGPLIAGDGDGDGEPDLFAIDGDDLLFHTLPPTADERTEARDTGAP